MSSTLSSHHPTPSILLCTSSLSGQQILYIYPPPTLHPVPPQKHENASLSGGVNPKDAMPSRCPLTHFYHFKVASLAPLLTNSASINQGGIHGGMSSSNTTGMQQVAGPSMHHTTCLSIPPYFFLSRVVNLHDSSDVIQKCAIVLMMPMRVLQRSTRRSTGTSSNASSASRHQNAQNNSQSRNPSSHNSSQQSDSQSQSDIAIYQNLLNMIAIAYQREQKRCQFLEKCLLRLLKLREEDSSLATWDELHQKVRSWNFIQNLVKVTMAVTQGGSLEVRVNGWVEVGCRLPTLGFEPTASARPPPTQQRPSKKRPTFSSDQHVLVRMYDACVKVKEENLPHRLKFPPDGLHDIQSVLQWVSPLKSLQDIAREQNLATSLVLNIAQHLVGWGIIRPISKLTKNSILVIADCATFPPPQSDVDKFDHEIRSTYPRIPCLVELLAFFSTQRVFQDVLLHMTDQHTRMPSYGTTRRGPSSTMQQQNTLDDTAIIKTIVWLLENCYIRSVKQYIQFCIPPDVSSYLQQSSPNPSSASGTSNYMSRTTVLNDYEIEFLREKCNDKRLLALVKQLCGYFNGEYTIEEILSLENVSREELNRLLHTYKDVIISYDE